MPAGGATVDLVQSLSHASFFTIAARASSSAGAASIYRLRRRGVRQESSSVVLEATCPVAIGRRRAQEHRLSKLLRAAGWLSWMARLLSNHGQGSGRVYRSIFDMSCFEREREILTMYWMNGCSICRVRTHWRVTSTHSRLSERLRTT